MNVLALVVTSGLLSSNDFGLKFLEENKAKDGVITLDSGLQYKVLRVSTLSPPLSRSSSTRARIGTMPYPLEWSSQRCGWLRTGYPRVRKCIHTHNCSLRFKCKAGDGEDHPLASTSCECHYEGRTAQEFPEGKTFDSR